MEKITFDKRNYRKHSDENKRVIKKSLEELGAGRSVLIDKDGALIAGNGVYEQAQKLKMPVRVIETDGTELVAVKRTDIAEGDERRKRLALADNVASDLSEFDDDLLHEDFSMEELSDWGLESEEEVNEEETKNVQEDDFDEEKDKVETVCKKGDIWLLGEHRLLCGDSTDPADVALLMGEETADMTFTDPPYNIDYRGVNDTRKIKNDKMTEDDFVEFLTKALMKTDTAYVCCSWQYAHLFRKAMEAQNMAPKAMIVWDKVNPAQHLDKYFKQHEIIWYFGKFGGQKTLRGDIWQCKRQVNTLHPTMKPIELIAMALNDNPDKKIVFDGFGGSGSTLIACQQLNRRARLIELDPHYCDVIIARWEKLTGQKATRL